eukprot:31485-Pelagococcus_subviridis.AAC.16
MASPSEGRRRLHRVETGFGARPSFVSNDTAPGRSDRGTSSSDDSDPLASSSSSSSSSFVSFDVVARARRRFADAARPAASTSSSSDPGFSSVSSGASSACMTRGFGGAPRCPPAARREIWTLEPERAHAADWTG